MDLHPVSHLCRHKNHPAYRDTCAGGKTAVDCDMDFPSIFPVNAGDYHFAVGVHAKYYEQPDNRCFIPITDVFAISFDLGSSTGRNVFLDAAGDAAISCSVVDTIHYWSRLQQSLYHCLCCWPRLEKAAADFPASVAVSAVDPLDCDLLLYG